MSSCLCHDRPVQRYKEVNLLRTKPLRVDILPHNRNGRQCRCIVEQLWRDIDVARGSASLQAAERHKYSTRVRKLEPTKASLFSEFATCAACQSTPYVRPFIHTAPPNTSNLQTQTLHVFRDLFTGIPSADVLNVSLSNFSV